MRWILQGSLYDPFDEFFVKSIENVNEEKASKDDHIIDEDSLENPLNNKFQLRVEMIPCHISVSTAEKIYFIGESIQLFERDRDLGTKYLVFVSSRSVKMRGFSFLSLYKSLFIF